MSKLKSKKVQLLIIVFLTILVYSNIFANDFASDDVGYFLNWQTPKHFENIGKILTIESVPPDEGGVYRPVKGVALMLSWAIFGINKIGYHAVGLGVHLGSTALVYLIAAQLVGRVKRTTNYLPFLTALLFGLHPIHTEAVTFMLASFDSIGFLFFLAAVWSYLHKGRFWYLASVILAVLAFFTYELTLSLPFVLILIDLLSQKIKPMRYVPFFAVLAFYLFIRFVVLNIGDRGSFMGDSFYKTQLVMTFAWVKYLFLMIWPVNLSIDHNLLPGVYSVIYKAFVSQDTLNGLMLFSPRVIFNLVILGGLTGLGTFLLGVQGLRVVGFGILWFFMTLLPAGFLLPQSSIMAERYAYLAVFGWCLVVAYLVVQFASWRIKLKVQGLGILLTVILVSAYGVRTYTRNFDYRSTLTFWQKLADQSPDNVVSNYTLARIYVEKNDFNQALNYFDKVLSLNPGLVEVNYTVGKILLNLGRVDEAQEQFEAASGTANKQSFSTNKYSTFAQWELERLKRLESFSEKQGTDKIGKWGKFNFGIISFEYPLWWLVTESKNQVFFDSGDGYISVGFSQYQLTQGQTPQSYLEKVVNVGSLVRSSEAKIADFDSGVAKYFKDNDVQRLEFVLFKGKNVVRIWVYPFVSPGIKDFDRMLGTIVSN